MTSSHNLDRLAVTFDAPSTVAHAGRSLGASHIASSRPASSAFAFMISSTLRQ